MPTHKKFASPVASFMLLMGSTVQVPLDSITYFNLPAQPLGDALRAMAVYSNTNIIFAPELVANKLAPALRGELTRRQALSRLLANTGIDFFLWDGRTAWLAAGPDYARQTKLSEDRKQQRNPHNHGVSGKKKTSGKTLGTRLTIAGKKPVSGTGDGELSADPRVFKGPRQ